MTKNINNQKDPRKKIHNQQLITSSMKNIYKIWTNIQTLFKIINVEIFKMSECIPRYQIFNTFTKFGQEIISFFSMGK